MRGGRGPCRGLAGALAAMLLALAALPAGAESKLINPCRFSSFDSPCQVRGGTYRALVPQGIGPHPALVYLYGSFGQSERITGSGYFQRNVVRRGYALIAPSALEVEYRGGRTGTGWGRKARRGHPRDDLAFLRRVLSDARTRFNIDPDRLIFVGQSDGGFFIWEIACHHPRMAAAYAVHAASYGWQLPERCDRPVHFLQGHGRRDRVVPFEGPIRQGPRLMAPPVAEAMRVMARTNGCRAEGRPGSSLRGFERLSWAGCRREASLDFLVHDGGHGWPRDWMPAVLDWFEETRVRPAEAVTRRVGDRPGVFGTGGDAGLVKKAPGAED